MNGERINKPEPDDKLQALKDFSDQQKAKRGLEHAVLNESGEVQLVSFFEWAMWFERNQHQRVIQQDYAEGYKVSTIFTGLDLGWNPEHPLWFETMVFGPKEETKWFDGTTRMLRSSLWTERCSSLAQAKAMHQAGQEWLNNYLHDET